MYRRLAPALVACLVLAGGAAAQEGPGLEARVWLDRGTDPVLDRGDRVRVYYRTSDDAYVTLFHINTDGALRMVHPRGPEDATLIRGGRDYRVLFPRSPYWYVDEYEGKGYFFAVASPVPFDFGAFRYVAREQAWDLSAVGKTVYGDPYLAIDDVVAAILPEWETTPYALDFISYDVGSTHDYPRFLCYQCHGFRSYATWNPYTYACTDFRVVVWNDPYFMPAYRYGPTRVVYTTSLRGRARFEFKERGVGEAWSPLVRTRQPPVRRPTQYVEPSAAAPPQRTVVPPRRRIATPSDGLRPDAPRSGPGAPALRRPSDGSGSGGATAPDLRRPTDPGARTGGAVRPAPPGTRPVLERRPAGPSARPSGGPPVRPSTGPATRPSGARPSARPSGSKPGGSVGPSARPTAGSRPSARPGGSARPSGSRPSARPGGTRPSARPSGARPGGPARPSARPSGSRPGGSARPSARPSGSRPGGSARPSARPSGSRPGGSARPSARPSGSRPGGSAARPSGNRPGGGAPTA